MTTVVYDGRDPKHRVVAADSQVSGGVPQTTQKLVRVKGAIIGVAGDLEEATRFVNWYKDRRKAIPQFSREEDDDWEAIVVTKSKVEWWGPGGVPIPITEPYYAIGTGAEYAIGVLDMGHTIDDAMRVALHRDKSNSGPPIVKMTL